MGILKTIVNEVFNYKLVKMPLVGEDPFKDFKLFLRETTNNTFIDIGAHIGETIDEILENYKSPIIHSFKPNQNSFTKLHERFGSHNDVTLNNIALGSREEEKEFNENKLSALSSFLESGDDIWGEVDKKKKVSVGTLDNYCQKNSISKINVLKMDTQGFELEILKGAKSLLVNHSIDLIYFEVTYADIYKDFPHFDELYKLLRINGYRLVTYYESRIHNNLISWNDVLFVSPKAISN